MTLQSLVANAPSPVQPSRSTAFTREVVGAASLYDAEVNVCVIRREADPAIARFVRDVLVGQCVEQLVRLSADAPVLDALVPGVEPSLGYDAFARDVRSMVELFADLVGAETIGLRLCGTRAVLCPRFHVDRVVARLICTYAGPGTEWLESRDVDRARLGHAAGGVADEVSGLIRTGGQVLSMSAFDVGLFKGEAWPGNAGNGAVHRSPPSDAWRVVLTLDVL